MEQVLVTGGSGFVGSHVVLQLLEAGHDVRTTVRSLDREAGLREMLKGAGVDSSGRLTVFAANLEHDQGWAEAAAGCEYVIHVASPMPAAAPRNEDEVIRPARDGVLRVLKAARDAKVWRVVMTSSCGAIYYGHPPRTTPFDETSWTDIDGDMSAYVRSKAIAERAAWDFMSTDGGSLEREGRARARLAASSTAGGHSRHRREPHPLRHRQRITVESTRFGAATKAPCRSEKRASAEAARRSGSASTHRSSRAGFLPSPSGRCVRARRTWRWSRRVLPVRRAPRRWPCLRRSTEPAC